MGGFISKIESIRRPSFALLCVVVGLQSIGGNLVHPVEPAFYIALGLPDWIFGAAFAAMALGLFLFSPFWGVISDRIGRVPTLALTLLMYGTSQLAFLLSTTVPTILIARFAAGASCSGCGVAAMAYVADTSSPQKCGRNMLVYAAVINVCTALGFLVGGIVGKDDPGRAFVAQFFIFAAIASMAYVLLGEGPHFVRSCEPLTVARANPLAAFAGTRSLLTPWMIAFLLAVGLASFASSAYDNAFNYYLRDQFAFPPTYNGYIYGAVGIVGFAANLTIGMKLQRSRNVELSLSVVLMCAAASLGATLLMHRIPEYLAVNMVFYIFNSMYMPIMQAMALSGDDSSHGTVSGLFQSIKSLGMVPGALAAGFIYEMGPLLPFAMAALAFLLAAVSSLSARHYARVSRRV